MSFFSKRNLLIVTKHGKELVLKPLLENGLNVKCNVTSDFDTDSFGMFSGEITRKEDALNTVRNKCLAAMSVYDCDLAVASEGSFGPHPAAFFASADDELVVLIDLKNNIEIIGRKLSMETNFAAKSIKDKTIFLEFLSQIKFPSHGIILKNAEIDASEIYKDSTTELEAIRHFDLLLAKYGTVYVETDMRAMNNPLRMKVIQNAAKNLIEKVNSLCPKCEYPGFSVTQSVKGLPCKSCGLPTNSVLYLLKSCSKCDYSERNYFPRNMKTEEPIYCDNCNP